ncbi:MAG: formylglycine-generating enzyme family protein [Pseudobdellovibrionaceae bacterium]
MLLAKFGLSVLFLFASVVWAKPQDSENILIPKGSFKPFFKEEKDKEVLLNSFFIDKYPVTKSDFNKFLESNPQFQKSKIVKIYADQRYLEDWKAELLSESELKVKGRSPVTFVSWFVAKRYCKHLNKRLPTIAEWEYASDSTNPEILKSLLEWYAKTGDQQLPDVGQKKPNKFGVHDMHGVIWEWVDDFSSVMISSDSRSKGDRTDGFFCGGGSVSSQDAEAYATFMRYAFRSGLKGDYTIKNLGFRCVTDVLAKGEK